MPVIDRRWMKLSEAVISHTAAYRRRRFVNWFPMGLTYAFLYMGRYNLTVAKNALGDLMTKEDFGLIFGIGTAVYAISFLVNGPLTDKLGGKKAILFAAMGSGLMNLLMGLYLRELIVNPGGLSLELTSTMCVLYAFNMYFQSAAAVAIVKVNAHWFHVRERGGFSGIFGTMISSGIFFAFTVNGWVLGWTEGWGPGGAAAPWFVFLLPSILLFIMFAFELVVLRDSPGQAGFEDFDTGDASSGEADDVDLFAVVKRIFTNPIILTVAAIEFCTGVIRNGVMHWFPIYAKEVWVLPSDHMLRNGSWGEWWIVAVMFGAAAVLIALGTRSTGRRKATLIISGALVALAPFVQAGWGGLLFVAGVIGANVAGWVSDLFFQSRRAPTAGGLYLLLAVGIGVSWFVLGGSTNRVGWADEEEVPLRVGDVIVSVAGNHEIEDWSDVTRTVKCIPSRCEGDGVSWDSERCLCSSNPAASDTGLKVSGGIIDLVIERDGTRLDLELEDSKAVARAGDTRTLAAGPELTLWPFFLGILMFLVSLGVIGTHGLLSGTATMDFGGRKGAATAVGMIDGFVYLGTAVQSIALGYITTRDWSFWPVFLFPFAILGLVLLTRIWHAKPGGSGGH